MRKTKSYLEIMKNNVFKSKNYLSDNKKRQKIGKNRELWGRSKITSCEFCRFLTTHPPMVMFLQLFY